MFPVKKRKTGRCIKVNVFRRISIFLIPIFFLLFPSTSSIADDPESKLGNWIGAQSTLVFTDHWSFFLQGELRTWEFFHNLNELLWRFAPYYNINKRYMVSIGYVRVDTWPYDDEPYQKFDENRLYEEFLISSKWGKKLKVKHRFRLEQRWITTIEYGTEYSNRIRYKLGFTLPLKGETIEPGGYYLTLLNEIFWDFDRFDYWFDREAGESGLNQNRLLAGIGRQISSMSKFQAGIMWQHRPKADFWRLILTYTHNIDFR